MNQKFEDEARLFAVLNHPNIVACVALRLRSENQFIALELMKSDLKSYVTKMTEEISLLSKIKAVYQIAQAMQYLEERRIVHRDLAARNVLVGNNGIRTVKLNDFGLSRTLSTSNYYKKSSNDKIPIRWMSPESVLDRKYTSASDVWSFGVFCWEVLEEGKVPYAELRAEMVLAACLKGHRLQKPTECPREMYKLEWICVNFLIRILCSNVVFRILAHVLSRTYIIIYIAGTS